MTIETTRDIAQLDRFLTSIFEGLPIAPGTICRIAYQFLENWGVRVTDENRGWIERRSEKSYIREWSSGTKETNDAIEKATREADLGGNSFLNTMVATTAVKALLEMYEPGRRIRICDVGTGAGDTISAILDSMQSYRLQDIVKQCSFYLIEPSVDRLRHATRRLEKHGIIERRVKPEFIGMGTTEGRIFGDLKDGIFDLIVSSAVFHHLSFPTYLNRINDKLTNDGALIIGDWYTTIWQHPAYMVPVLQGIGAEQERIVEFERFFNLDTHNIRELDGKLRLEQKEANKRMYDYIFHMVREMKTLKVRSQLLLFEAHESVDDRLGKLERAGFEISVERLRESTVMKSIVSGFEPGGERPYLSLFRKKHDIAGVIPVKKKVST